MTTSGPVLARRHTAANGSVASASVMITHGDGLHARPSVRFTQIAKRHAAEIEIALDVKAGPWADAKSILKVMGLKAPCGSVLHLRAFGPDAANAVAALVALVECGFADQPQPGCGHGPDA
jgi:phosphocarrier protein HPr